MKMLQELSLAWAVPGVGPDCVSYRPPKWPPPVDWPVSLDSTLTPVSFYGEDIWDFTYWVGSPYKLNFTGGQKGSRAAIIDKGNAELLKLVMAWFIWGKFAASKPSTLTYYFTTIRPLFVVASRNGILATDLMRFPKVLDALKKVQKDSSLESLPLLLHRLWDSREDLGIVLLDSSRIQTLAEIACSHDRKQTPYIPPRIWSYQVGRLKECLDDYMSHRAAIEACFNYCVDAYAQIHGSLERAMILTGNKSPSKKPFSNQPQSAHANNLTLCCGKFVDVASRYGLRELLEKWVARIGNETKLTVSDFSQYLTLCQRVSYAYILNFTVQRKGEAASLRTSCLLWEDDPLGRIPMICGETTKTTTDSDARWPTSPSAVVAIEVGTSIAQLRMRCAAAHPEVNVTDADRADPYLFHRVFEPFGNATDRSVRYSILPQTSGYLRTLEYFPRLFDPEQLRITQEDRRIALMFTPWLDEDDDFSVGKVWPLGWHQLRRTSAVNMFASELLSDSSVQFLMKHSAASMSRYYGRGRGRLRINEVATKVVITSMYEVRAEEAKGLQSDRYVSPLGFERIREDVVDLIAKKDAKALAKAGGNGQVFFRLIRLGACTSQSDCQYGGIESVAHCGGGETGKPCSEVLFDREKEVSITEELQELELEISTLPPGTPRHKALAHERTALENYLNVIAE